MIIVQLELRLAGWSSVLVISFLFSLLVLCVSAVISNSMVIIAVWKIKKMRNVTNILICNLSISDIILAGIILPQNLHDLSHEENFQEGESVSSFFITII